MSADSPSKSRPTPPTVEVRGACDLRCAWCNYAGTMALAPPDEVERVGSVLERLRSEGHRRVSLGVHHSEPTTHPELPRIVERARSLGFVETILSTSGLRIADRGYLERLRDAGLGRVMLTVAGVAGERTDMVLGRPGSAAAKLQALACCRDVGVDVHVALMLLRPMLHGLDAAAREVLGLLGEDGTAHAQVLDVVKGLSPERHRALWPVPGEILWTMERLRRVDPVMALQGSDLSEDLRHAVAKAGPPTSEALRSVEPPQIGIAELRRVLDLDFEKTSDRASQALWSAAALLGRLDEADRNLAGLKVGAVRLENRTLRTELCAPDGRERVAILVEDAAAAERAYLRGRTFATSYEESTELDTERKRHAVELLHGLLERGVAVER